MNAADVFMEIFGYRRVETMEGIKLKDIPCKRCGSLGELCGSDHTNEYGPFFIACMDCGEETISWAYPREAWKQWKIDN